MRCRPIGGSVMSDQFAAARDLLSPVRAAMYDWDASGIRSAFAAAAAPNAVFQLASPFETLGNAADFARGALDVLERAWPDVERRDYIVMAGDDPIGATWVGCAGFYTGTFARPFLGIPPTGHQAAMRFHEFYRVEEGRIVAGALGYPRGDDAGRRLANGRKPRTDLVAACTCDQRRASHRASRRGVVSSVRLPRHRDAHRHGQAPDRAGGRDAP